jgi:rSAM-associated Gly-rich repeat protein
MKISNQLSFVGFLLAASTISISPVNANNQVTSAEYRSLNVEQRLTRLTEAVKEKEVDITENPLAKEERNPIAQWINGYRGGWANGYRGSFVNRRYGGGFVNRGWPNGGRFYNRRYRY